MFNIIIPSRKILSLHYQSHRLILCTIPPHIFCRPDTFRYTLAINVHDQRLRQLITRKNNIKLSSPTLRKLCLPCITARNHSNKNKKTPKTNQHRIVPPEKNGVESLERLELAPRTSDTLLTTPVVHSSHYSRGNNANNFHEERQHPHFEISKEEEKYDETSLVKIESQPFESVLLPLSLLTNEDDLVGIDRKKNHLQVRRIE